MEKNIDIEVGQILEKIKTFRETKEENLLGVC